MNLSPTQKAFPRIVLTTLALAAVSAVWIGCGGGNQDEPPATAASTGGGSSRRACENVKSLAQVCYDSADPGVSCPALGATMRNEAAKKGLDPSLQQDLGTLCQNACAQRRSGESWSTISARLDCSSRY